MFGGWDWMPGADWGLWVTKRDGSGSKREAAEATWLLWIVWGSDWLMADDR
jgi:hypothetical protein